MKRTLTALLLGLPLSIQAECNDFADYLFSEFPDRMFVERFGANSKFAIYEPSPMKDTSTVSIVGCIDGKYQMLRSFPFKVRHIDQLKYSEKHNRLYVIFKTATEYYGWIEKLNGEYVFEMFHDPEL